MAHLTTVNQTFFKKKLDNFSHYSAYTSLISSKNIGEKSGFCEGFEEE